MKIPVGVPNVLLPKKGIDMTKWAVVACDQFTSEPQYWRDLEELTANAESTLRITFPEAYLSRDNAPIIASINANMEKYMREGVLCDKGACFVLIERKTEYVERRLGLVLAVDLEHYSFKREDYALIRATEGTVIERIPPRVRIRENAPIECPHVMLLVDDDKKSVIEPLYEKRAELEPLYDFELNMGGGHIKGWKVENTETVIKKLANLIESSELKRKYGTDADVMLFAVGDGNHSLATAKQCWNNIKAGLTEKEKETHPARYAMVEIENLYDDGLAFEPIHRVVFDANEELIAELKKLQAGENKCLIMGFGREEKLMLPESAEAVKLVQDCLDAYKAKHPHCEIDYVHGEENLRSVVKENKNSIAITLPKPQKSQLFNYVLKNGAYPRKTFSMGEAPEKRYYIECRKIK